MVMGISLGAQNLAVHLLLFGPIAVAASALSPVQAAGALLGRVLTRSKAERWFRLELVPKDSSGKDVMEYESVGGRVVLRGSDAVSLASAFNWYLNDVVNTTYDWSTYELSLPEEIPLPASRRARSRIVDHTYYMNICTFGYSLAFVDWSYWEKHIDWMAMQGVNLPLAFVGQEAVLVRTFERFNITFKEMQDFISGPGFLPWFQLGNLQGWAGPMSNNWIHSRVALQQQLLSRMRELAMTPVLPAFAGFVPAAFATKHPSAKIIKGPAWNNFSAPYGPVRVLQPTEVLFQDVGQAFIQEQTKLYGTNHMYQCDTYNEVDPVSTDLGYLRNSSAAVYSAMKSVDPRATWLMQGWAFEAPFWKDRKRIQAYVEGVPGDGLWILDLQTDEKPMWELYFGKPVILNTLHNFGGQQGLTGNLPQIRENFAKALDKSSSIRGIGITMEGIWTNYIVYDYTLSMAWNRSVVPETASWARTFAARRYGVSLGARSLVALAWEQLYLLAYTHGGKPRSGQLACRPVLRKMGKNTERSQSSRTSDWFSVWGMFFELAAKFPILLRSAAFQFDYVDIGREYFTRDFDDILTEFRKAATGGDAKMANAHAFQLQGRLMDLDRFLSTSSHFMLGPRLKQAQSWGNSICERKQLEFNVKNQVTLWGPTGQINDYATKSWGGLVSSYFLPRWKLFTQRVLESISMGIEFNQSEYDQDVFDLVELPWQTSTFRYPVQPEESPFMVAAELVVKHAQAQDVRSSSSPLRPTSVKLHASLNAGSAVVFV